MKTTYIRENKDNYREVNAVALCCGRAAILGHKLNDLDQKYMYGRPYVIFWCSSKIIYLMQY